MAWEGILLDDIFKVDVEIERAQAPWRKAVNGGGASRSFCAGTHDFDASEPHVFTVVGRGIQG